MADNAPLHNPYLALYSFFDHEDGQETATEWYTYLADRLGVKVGEANDLEQDDFSCHVYYYSLQDSIVVYAAKKLKQDHPISAWNDLSQTIFGDDWQALERLSQAWQADCYWGLSIFFGGEVRSKQAYEQEQPWLKQIKLPAKMGPRLEPIPSDQSWGRVWQLAGEQLINIDHTFRPPQIYTVLPLVEQEAIHRPIFFTMGNVDVVELSLNKVYQQFRSYHYDKLDWQKQANQLDQNLKTLLGEVSQETWGEQSKRPTLARLSEKFVDFVSWTTEVKELHQTIKINSNNYHKLTTELKLLSDNDQVFNTNLIRLKQATNQLTVDNIYYTATVQRLNTRLQTIQTTLELALVEAEHQTAKNWRQIMWRNEARERRENSQQRREEEREQRLQLLLARIGLLLGLTQVWPIFQTILDSLNFSNVFKASADTIALVVIVLLALFILGKEILSRYKGN